MYRFLATFAASSALCTPAAAQTFSSPPDVGTYQPRSVTYAAGTTPNVLGDGSDAKGGIAPAFSTHPEPNEDESKLNPGWILTPSTDNYCKSGTIDNGKTCDEAKWRTAIDSSHFGYDDPIRYWGQPGVSHCHEFFGNEGVNAYTTRATLRARPKSSAAGGPYQSTGYWEPCWLKTINGKLYAQPASRNIIYYDKTTPIGEAIVDDYQRLHTLLRFVGGFPVDDPTDSGPKAEIAAANAQPGTAGRYSYIDYGFSGYSCQLANGQAAATKAGAGGSSVSSRGFTMADGSDPWEGRCVAGAAIFAENNAPGCWDGWNVSSPSGYSHFRYEVRDNVTGKTVCPNGWYRVPRFQVKSYHMTQGFADYSTWKLSSDAMVSAKLGYTIIPGSSAHFDWENGQAKSILNRWLPFCMGIGGAVAHACDYSTIDASGRLLSDSPAPEGGRNPQVNNDRIVNSNDPTQLHLVDTTRPMYINMKGM